MSRERRTRTQSADTRTHDPCSCGGVASRRRTGVVATIGVELRAHAPFTMLGTLTGIGLMLAIVVLEVPRWASVTVFWSLHPIHVFLSALVTTGLYALHGARRPWAVIAIGYSGSIGIATLSDCVIPYLGEMLLNLPNRDIHLGFLEKWWLVNPAAAAGIAAGYLWPHTKFPHAGHVLLSTWTSLFHIVMALGTQIGLGTWAMTAVFLFLAVWLPCCTSDIVFPLLFSKGRPAKLQAAVVKPNGGGRPQGGRAGRAPTTSHKPMA